MTKYPSWLRQRKLVNRSLLNSLKPHLQCLSSTSPVCFLVVGTNISVCVCVCVQARKHIRTSSPGNHDQPSPPKILVMLLFLCSLPWHVPCAAHQTLLIAGSLQQNVQKTEPWSTHPPSCCQTFHFFLFPLRQARCCRVVFLCVRSQEMSDKKKKGYLDVTSQATFPKMEPNVLVVNEVIYCNDGVHDTTLSLVKIIIKGIPRSILLASPLSFFFMCRGWNPNVCLLWTSSVVFGQAVFLHSNSTDAIKFFTHY